MDGSVVGYSLSGANVHPRLIHDSLNQPESVTQTAFRSVQSFAGLTTVTDRQTDRPTDHATPSVTIGRISTYVVLRCGLKIIENGRSMSKLQQAKVATW